VNIVVLSGTIAFITSLIGLLPQIIKALKTKSTQDISMLMVINYLLCSFAWIVYGAYTDSLFVLASNVIGLLTCCILILQKRYYDAL